MAIVPRPEVVEAVARMPPLRPEQIAQLRRILHDWPARIQQRIEATLIASNDDPTVPMRRPS